MNPFKKDKKQVSIFITAGYPNKSSLVEQISLLESKGIDFVEVGIPFSDPLADGPIIQETSRVALQNGMNIDLIFDQLAAQVSNMPIVLMGYLNPIMNYGMEKFLQKCQVANIAALIIPDVSIEIYEKDYQKLFETYEIAMSFLITQTTNKERIIRTAELCKNSFVYLVSSNSTTGGSAGLSEKGIDSFERIKNLCGDTPLFVGFGIQSLTDVQKVQKHTDGAIIGSAYLKAVRDKTEVSFLQSIRP